MTKEKNRGGRPPFYKAVEELESKIDEYFNSGIKIREVLIGKIPNQTLVKVPVPTISGLAIFLGFESRQSFYAYENKEEFSYTIKKARFFIEREYEEQLQYGNTVGAIFALKNMGWRDKQEIEHSGNVGLSDRLSKAIEDKKNNEK